MEIAACKGHAARLSDPAALMRGEGTVAMEFHQLKYFLAIAEQSSIAKASKQLHVSQSALSVALRDLERDLGFPLFDRDGRGLVINENGRYLARQVRAALATISDARVSIADNVARRENTVKCATNMTLGKVSGLLIQNYRRTHPQTILRVGFKDSLTFKNASPDLEFLGTPRELKQREDRFKIAHERFVAVFAERVAPHTETVRLEDLVSEPFILPGPGEMQNALLGMFEEAGYMPHVVSELQLYSEVLYLVRAGLGYTIAPELSWLDDVNGLAVKPISDVQRGRNIYALIPEGAAPSPAALEFFEFLRTDAERILQAGIAGTTERETVPAVPVSIPQ